MASCFLRLSQVVEKTQITNLGDMKIFVREKARYFLTVRID